MMETDAVAQIRFELADASAPAAKDFGKLLAVGSSRAHLCDLASTATRVGLSNFSTFAAWRIAGGHLTSAVSASKAWRIGCFTLRGFESQSTLPFPAAGDVTDAFSKTLFLAEVVYTAARQAHGHGSEVDAS